MKTIFLICLAVCIAVPTLALDKCHQNGDNPYDWTKCPDGPNHLCCKKLKSATEGVCRKKCEITEAGDRRGNADERTTSSTTPKRSSSTIRGHTSSHDHGQGVLDATNTAQSETGSKAKAASQKATESGDSAPKQSTTTRSSSPKWKDARIGFEMEVALEIEAVSGKLQSKDPLAKTADVPGFGMPAMAVTADDINKAGGSVKGRVEFVFGPQPINDMSHMNAALQAAKAFVTETGSQAKPLKNLVDEYTKNHKDVPALTLVTKDTSPNIVSDTTPKISQQTSSFTPGLQVSYGVPVQAIGSVSSGFENLFTSSKDDFVAVRKKALDLVKTHFSKYPNEEQRLLRSAFTVMYWQMDRKLSYAGTVQSGGFKNSMDQNIRTGADSIVKAVFSDALQKKLWEMPDSDYTSLETDVYNDLKEKDRLTGSLKHSKEVKPYLKKMMKDSQLLTDSKSLAMVFHGSVAPIQTPTEEGLPYIVVVESRSTGKGLSQQFGDATQITGTTTPSVTDQTGIHRIKAIFDNSVSAKCRKSFADGSEVPC